VDEAALERVMTDGQSAPPTTDQTEQPPVDHYRRVLDYDVGVSMLMEMQSTLARLDEKFNGLRSSVDSMKGKVEDLVGWKNKILGGAIILGAVCSITGFGIAKFSSYVTIRTPHETHKTAEPSPAPAAPPAVPRDASSK
jgi:hypothetical protein